MCRSVSLNFFVVKLSCHPGNRSVLICACCKRLPALTLTLTLFVSAAAHRGGVALDSAGSPPDGCDAAASCIPLPAQRRWHPGVLGSGVFEASASRDDLLHESLGSAVVLGSAAVLSDACRRCAASWAPSLCSALLLRFAAQASCFWVQKQGVTGTLVIAGASPLSSAAGMTLMPRRSGSLRRGTPSQRRWRQLQRTAARRCS